jgi:hypothetical protein
VEGNHIPGLSRGIFCLAPIANALSAGMPTAAMAPVAAVTFKKSLLLIFILHLQENK